MSWALSPTRAPATSTGSSTTARPTMGQRSIDRMNAAWPNAQLVHLPVHASWLNQIEIVFSVIQRKVIKPADFADLAALQDRLERFEDRYNATARPFDWRFTSTDLAAMLERVDATTTPAPAGRTSPASRSASEPTSPTSMDATPTARSSSCAGCATADQPRPGASPSTEPATTTTRTTSSPTACPPAAPKTPSTAPAASTSTIPPRGSQIHRRTNARHH
jgi:hypothetical protein